MYTLTYIYCSIHNYIPNQAICVAKLCFYCVFSLKKTPHEIGSHVTLTLTLRFNSEEPIHIRVLYLHKDFVNID